MTSIIKPTEAELAILQVLWEQGPCTVRQINDLMNNKKEVGYTTTLKLLQIMAGKGIVAVNKSQRTHVYQAVLRQEETQRQLVDQFLETAFGGSAKRLVMQLLGHKTPDQRELDEIKRLISKLEGGEL